MRYLDWASLGWWLHNFMNTQYTIRFDFETKSKLDAESLRNFVEETVTTLVNTPYSEVELGEFELIECRDEAPEQ